VAGATTTAMETLSTVLSPATHRRCRPASLISRVLGSCFLRYARFVKLGGRRGWSAHSTFLCRRAGQWMHVLLDGCGRGLVAYPGRAIPILVLDLLPFQISLVLEVVQQACRSKPSVGVAAILMQCKSLGFFVAVQKNCSFLSLVVMQAVLGVAVTWRLS
jgi:hypothetical protein